MTLSPEALIAFLNSRPPELVWILEILVCYSAVLILQRLFGKHGLYLFIVVAIIAANIQVLKAVKFSVYPDPVALGTVLFSASYLCTDILTEHYGRAAARRGVLLGFAGMLLMTVVMLVALGFRPMTPEEAGEGMAWALPNHGHMLALFLPAPALFAASMCAYLLSQFNDIWLFALIRRLTGGRMLWLRNNASTAVSALIDNTVFSVLAWVVFAPEPIGLQALIFTYILGTYLLRLGLALLDTPFMYLSRYMMQGEPPLAGSRA